MASPQRAQVFEGNFGEVAQELARLREIVTKSHEEIQKLSVTVASLEATVRQSQLGTRGSEKNPHPSPKESKSSQPEERLDELQSIFDARLLNCFSKATREVFRILAHTEIKFLQSLVGNCLGERTEIVARSQLSHEGKVGYAGVAFSSSVLESLVRQMFRLPQEAVIPPEYGLDVAAEINNQILALAKPLTASLGVNLVAMEGEKFRGTQPELLQCFESPWISLEFSLINESFFVVFWG